MQKNNSKLLPRLYSYLQSEGINALLILAGIIFRLKHFLENRSLWVDEAYVAVNIINRSIKEILNLVYIFPEQPKSSLGFYLIEKIPVFLWGNHEMALRVFPLISSIAALILFYSLLKRICSKTTVSIALAFFAFNDFLIYYAAEVKQYSSDVLIALILLVVYERYMQKEISLAKARTWGIIGAVALWFANSSIFILAGIGLTSLIKAFQDKKFGQIKRLIVTFLLWGISFIFLYCLTLKEMVQSRYILSSFTEGFPPTPYFTGESLIWVKKFCFSLFGSLIGIQFPLLGIFLFVIGGYILLKRMPEKFLLIILPITFTVLATVSYLYPYRERLYLFLLCGFILLLSEGINSLIEAKQKFLRWVGYTVLIITLIQPITLSANHFIHRFKRENNRTAMQFLKDHYQTGDQIMLNNSAQFTFIYYLNRLNFVDALTQKEGRKKVLNVFRIYDEIGLYSGTRYFGMKSGKYLFKTDGTFRKTSFRKNPKDIDVLFPDMPHNILADMEKRRVWIFFSHIKPEVRNFILSVFDQQGTRAQAFETNKASAYLYTFK